MPDRGIKDPNTQQDSYSLGYTEEPELQVIECEEGTCLIWRDDWSEVVATVKEEEKKVGLIEEKRIRIEVQKKERKDPAVRDTMLGILEREQNSLRQDIKIQLNVDILSGEPFPGVIAIINEVIRRYKVGNQEIKYTVEEENEPIENLYTGRVQNSKESPMVRKTRTIKRNHQITQKVMVVEVGMV